MLHSSFQHVRKIRTRLEPMRNEVVLIVHPTPIQLVRVAHKSRSVSAMKDLKVQAEDPVLVSCQ